MRELRAAVHGEPLDVASFQESTASSQRAVQRDLDLRHKAVSELMADLAAEYHPVRQFRKTHLPNGLLLWEQVGHWIEQQLVLDGPSSIWYSVPLPIRSGREFDEVTQSWRPVSLPSVGPEELKRCSRSTERLEYALPEDKYSHSVPIAAGGVLQALRETSIKIQTTFNWTTVQATMFLLTDMVPDLPMIRVTLKNHSPITAAARIVLEIDPALSPKEVEDQYRSARKKLVPGRYRTQDKEHILLALFAAETFEDESWADLMKEWKEKHPESKFDDVAIFRRECNLAQTRLLLPKWELAADGGA